MDSSAISISDWAGLPKHLLDMVLKKLNLFSDYLRFSAVCVPWYDVAMENRKQFAEKIDCQLPMLLLPKKDDEKGEVKNIYDVTRNKFINIEARVPFSTRYGGSSKGWLITMGEDFLVTLINPISPEVDNIRLPPLMKNEQDYIIQIHKAILSCDPITEPDDYTVAVIYGDQSQLAFIKPGRQDADWTYIDFIRTVFEDIIYYEGRLHAINFESKVFAFDNKDIEASSVPRVLSPFPNQLNPKASGKSYIVQSLGGELLLVHRRITFFRNDDFYDPFRNTVNFEVYKWNPSGPIWVKMESLGGESLFLGDNMSTSILASEYPGCCPNSIYFTHDFDDILGSEEPPRDSGVFNLTNSTFAPHYVTDQASIIAMIQQPPIWFVPNFLSAKPFLIGTSC